MNLRLALSLVSVGTLAVACRQGSHTTVTNDGKTIAQQGLALASRFVVTLECSYVLFKIDVFKSSTQCGAV